VAKCGKEQAPIIKPLSCWCVAAVTSPSPFQRDAMLYRAHRLAVDKNIGHPTQGGGGSALSLNLDLV
jgi:hypothetical protein